MRKQVSGHSQSHRTRSLTMGVMALVFTCLSITSSLAPIAAAEAPPAKDPVAEQASSPKNTPEKTEPSGPLTVAEQANYYDITGTVDDPTALFSIKVDGEEIVTEESRPVVAAEPNEQGVYAWGYTIPERFAAGEHTVTVAAKVLGEAGKDGTPTVVRELPLVERLMTLIVAPPPVAPDPPTTPVVTDPKKDPVETTPVVTEPLPQVPEMGQFVPPSITDPAPGQPVVKSTKLYGVPVDDLMQTPIQQPASSTRQARDQQTDTPVAAPGATQPTTAPMTTPKPVVDHTADAQSAATVLEASSEGWRIFGTPWYMVALTVVIFGTGVALVTRTLARAWRATPLGRAATSQG